MQINNYSNQTTFGQKYQIDRLLSCACDKPFIRKADSVNLITSMLKLRKEEQREMLRHEKVFADYLKKTGEYILVQVPGLQKFVDKINKSSGDYKKYAIESATECFGEMIDIKHQIRSRNITKRA